MAQLETADHSALEARAEAWQRNTADLRRRAAELRTKEEIADWFECWARNFVEGEAVMAALQDATGCRPRKDSSRDRPRLTIVKRD